MAQEFLMRIRGLENNDDLDTEDQSFGSVDDFINLGFGKSPTVSVDVPTIYSKTEDTPEK
jgi:hypothetical protein